MPNVRGKNQKLIAVPLDADLLAELERARRGKNRSQFVREAIYEKLLKMGIRVPEQIVDAPDRVRLPAQRTTINGGTGHHVQQNIHLNEAAEGCPHAAAQVKKVKYWAKKKR